MLNSNELIVALATANAVSALAVVRLSGKKALFTVEKLMHLSSGYFSKKKRAVGNFADIDYLVAIAWSEGKSYTGEEMVDLICHGSPETASNIILKLEASGARVATPGEFTRRAWENGKLSSYDVLALSAKYSNNQKGSNLDQLAKQLLSIATEIEGYIEFGEDHEVADYNSIGILLHNAISVVSLLIQKVKAVELLPKVFLMGPVNSGKSTLFNKIIGKDHAVISDQPGTTREGLTRIINLQGRTVEVNDTAGFGGFDLDARALSLVLSSLKSSDRILWMSPYAEAPPKELNEQFETLKICTKADLKLVPLGKQGWIYYSMQSPVEFKRILDFITKEEQGSPSWRLERILKSLNSALFVMQTGDFALLAEMLSDVHYEANMPQKNGEAVLRALDRFCVGK